MTKVLTIAFNHVYISLRSPITLVMAFVMPVIFTAVLGATFGDEGDTQTDSGVALWVIDADNGSLAEAIRRQLAESDAVRLIQPEADADAMSLEAALAESERYPRILYLPAGLSQMVLQGESISSQLYLRTRDLQGSVVEQEINAILARISDGVNVAQQAVRQAERYQGFATETERQAYFDAALQQAQARLAEPSIRMNHVQAGAGTAPAVADGTVQSSPGNIVTFGLITLLSTAIVLVDERTKGTLRRLVTSPISKATLLAGKMLGPLMIGLLQMAVLVLVGQFVFGVDWGRSPLALLMVILSFDLAAVSLGLLLSTLVRTADQATGLMIATSMVLSALGGAWWPLGIVPAFMQTVARLFPSTWAMLGFQGIILRGAGVGEILTPVLVLLGFALLFFSLGVWRFRYE